MTKLGGRLILPLCLIALELIFRVGQRGPRQMPPLATKLVDPRGYEILRRWIASLDKMQTRTVSQP